MLKSKTLTSRDGQIIEILSEQKKNTSLRDVLIQNRNITDTSFFTPSLSGLHDPFLMPDMEKAVKRILEARERGERVIIFGDYDVDGVSSTALLYTFLTDIGIECSYRLPHRVKDGYGIKDYHFDELKEKNVKLVITVDCGTRDIEPITYAKSLGIDVIVTDHHAVPDMVPEGVSILNPKRRDSLYPFSGLAGAGVAFKLVHGILLEMKHSELKIEKRSTNNLGSEIGDLGSILTSYIDLTSLGTVADCMPLVGENRIITALGLKQMKQSRSSALRKYIENLDRSIDGDADVIGFQIGPRINAAGRMDSPLKALHWLLAEESKVDDWLEEVEGLNRKRQEAVKIFSEDALMTVDPEDSVLFYLHPELEHGLIGLIAGKLTEAYGKPAIALCYHSHDGKREYEKEVSGNFLEKRSDTLVASCRSPEWCNLVELLDECKEYFVRYGGHRQAAGFTIEGEKYEAFQRAIKTKFLEKYKKGGLPKKMIQVECLLSPKDISLASLDMIDTFRPFGIGNKKPIFLMEGLTVTEVRTIGKEKNHLSLSFYELPDTKCLLWNFASLFPTGAHQQNTEGADLPSPGDILSPIFTLERNIWNGKESVQIMIESFLEDENTK